MMWNDLNMMQDWWVAAVMFGAIVGSFAILLWNRSRTLAAPISEEDGE